MKRNFQFKVNKFCELKEQIMNICELYIVDAYHLTHLINF